MYRAVLILAVLLFTQLPALADRDEQTFTKLMEIASGSAPKDSPADMTGLRGGGKAGKSLGFYRDNSDIQFRSGYEKQPAKTMAEFAYDLAEFRHTKGGGFEHFVQYQKEQAERNKGKSQVEQTLMESLRGGKPDPYDPYVRAHVSYSDQRKFAETWWQSHYPISYKAAPMKDWWLNDSILDANNMWARVESSYFNCPEDEKATRVLWFDQELQALAQKM